MDVNRPDSYDQSALDIVNRFTTSRAAKELKQLLKGQSVLSLTTHFKPAVTVVTRDRDIFRGGSGGKVDISDVCVRVCVVP